MFNSMMFLNSLFLRRTQLLIELHGHTGQVVSLAISPSGELLASGGTDGVKVWNLSTGKEIPTPQQPLQERGQVSCVYWITRRNESFDTLCYGNALGYLVFLQHRPTEQRFESVCSARIARGGEILSMTAEDLGGGSTRIATGTRDKCVQVWTFDSSARKLLSVHSSAFSQEKDIIPKSLAFDGNESKDLCVFGLYDGGLHKYGGEDGKWLLTHQLGSKIGNAAINSDHRLCVIDNVGNGFDLYKLDTGNFVRTFVMKEPIKTYPKGVAFAHRGHAVVGGSDHGCVYIFDRKSGNVLHTLKHAQDGGVQTIAVHDGKDVTIASASASTTGRICVWRWRPTMEKRSGLEDGRLWNARTMLIYIVKAAILLAATAYLVEVVHRHSIQFLGREISMPKEQRKEFDYEGLREYVRKEMRAEMELAIKKERETILRDTALPVVQNVGQRPEVDEWRVADSQEAAFSVDNRPSTDIVLSSNSVPF
ncbi:WD40-repeat-containing domain protein [Crepidotus variabilis]|uniref:WD40-repeat-containing domain protein n=1 Tax=Crepidotus variabilis TaxID=179855 RepID=A0A9P6E7K6_9AGAR|nr:WD40-repeat-containing domain protein [Crepidotus variabilis]